MFVFGRCRSNRQIILKQLCRTVKMKHNNLYETTENIQKTVPSWVTAKKNKPQYPPKPRDKIREAEVERLMKIDEEARNSKCKIKWRYFAATIIERLPIIVPPLEPWEEAFYEMKEEIAKYHSKTLPDIINNKNFTSEQKDMMKDVGITKSEETDKINQIKEKVKVKIDNEEEDDDDDEDLSGLLSKSNQEQLKKRKLQELVVFAPIRTEADKRKDYKSLHRKLDEKLYLITKNKSVGKNLESSIYDWEFMKNEFIKKDISIRTTAEKCVSKYINNKLSTYFIGNTPCGYFVHVNNKERQEEEDVFGYKIFFHRTQLLSESKNEMFKLKLKLNEENVCDYMWLTKSEMKEILNSDYWNCINDIL